MVNSRALREVHVWKRRLPSQSDLWYSEMVLQVGYLLDRHDRPTLLWWCVVVGEAPCIATVFVTHLWQLLLTRALTGIAIGGVVPATREGCSSLTTVIGTVSASTHTSYPVGQT